MTMNFFFVVPKFETFFFSTNQTLQMSYNMPSQLPGDCLNEIFKYLEGRDSLYS